MLAWMLGPVYAPRPDPDQPHTLRVEDTLPLARRAWLLAVYGLLLAVLPACVILPAQRLLFFIGLGAMGLTVQFLDWVYHTDNIRSAAPGMSKVRRLLPVASRGS